MSGKFTFHPNSFTLKVDVNGTICGMGLETQPTRKTGFTNTGLKMGDQTLYTFTGFALGTDVAAIVEFAERAGMASEISQNEEYHLRGKFYTTDIATAVMFKMRWGGQ